MSNISGQIKGGAIETVVEVPQGVKDGVNQVFSLSETPFEDTEVISVNGLVGFKNFDYVLFGTIVTFAVAPLTSDRILAIYRLA